MEESLKNSQLVARHINKSWGSLTIYDDFSISFPANEITTILGPSGCGKSTLLNILAGSLNADHAQIDDFRARKISIIYQEPRLLPWKTCLENIEFVLPENIHKVLAKEIGLRYLEMMQLDKFKDFFPSQLSGGMKQRLSMARAFAFPSEIILMDEPFRALDVKLKETLMLEFLKLWEKDRRTVIFVTHDIDEALELGKLIYVFSRPEVRIAGSFINYIGADKLELNRQIVSLF